MNMSKKDKEATRLLKRLRDDLRERAKLNQTEVVPVSNGIWMQVNDFLERGNL